LTKAMFFRSDRNRANAGISALEALNVMAFEQELAPRISFGEIEGVMLAAGRYRNREAIQIRNEMYGFIWCTLSKDLIAKFGDEHSMSDIWKGKTLGVHGRLNYALAVNLRPLTLWTFEKLKPSHSLI